MSNFDLDYKGTGNGFWMCKNGHKWEELTLCPICKSKSQYYIKPVNRDEPCLAAGESDEVSLLH